MYSVVEATTMSMALLRSTGPAVPSCAGTRPRHAFSDRPWHGSLTSTMPSLGKGHGKALEAIPTNGTCRLKEPST